MKLNIAKEVASLQRMVVDFRAEGDRTILQVVGIQNGKQTGRRAK